MESHLPLLQPEKWRRYYFESKDRYYTIVLQQDYSMNGVLSNVTAVKIIS